MAHIFATVALYLGIHYRPISMTWVLPLGPKSGVQNNDLGKCIEALGTH